MPHSTAGVHTKLMAALNTSKPRSSKGVKRKHEDDNDLRAVIESILTNDNGDNSNNDNDNNIGSDDNNSSTIDKLSWVDCWIDQPPGKRGCVSKDTWLGWGKLEIMRVTGITEAQYIRYMVSLSIVLAVWLTDSIFTQKSTHCLCDCYFDVLKGFCKNVRINSTGFAIIVKEVCLILCHSLSIISIC